MPTDEDIIAAAIEKWPEADWITLEIYPIEWTIKFGISERGVSVSVVVGQDRIAFVGAGTRAELLAQIKGLIETRPRKERTVSEQEYHDWCRKMQLCILIGCNNRAVAHNSLQCLPCRQGLKVSGTIITEKRRLEALLAPVVAEPAPEKVRVDEHSAICAKLGAAYAEIIWAARQLDNIPGYGGYISAPDVARLRKFLKDAGWETTK